jgi:hypothetical protein
MRYPCSSTPYAGKEGERNVHMYDCIYENGNQINMNYDVRSSLNVDIRRHNQCICQEM